MFEYDEASRRAVETLDGYNLTDFISGCYTIGCTNLWDVKDRMAEMFSELEPVLDDLTSDEFMEYLCNRYNVRFEEETSYWMRGTPNRMKG